MKTQTNKNIFDYQHVKSVSAVCLLKDGKQVGRIVANWSDNPNGSVCTAQVCLWDGVLSEQIKKRHVKTDFLDCELSVVMIGKAGGYGYDKLSSAIYEALRKGGLHELVKVEPGSGNQQKAFEEAGFTYIPVI